MGIRRLIKSLFQGIVDFKDVPKTIRNPRSSRQVYDTALYVRGRLSSRRRVAPKSAVVGRNCANIDRQYGLCSVRHGRVWRKQ